MSDEEFANGTTPIVPVDPDLSKCNYFVNTDNKTVVFYFTNPYGGIPQNLAFNLIGFVALFILFAILRRAAGNYGRLVREANMWDVKLSITYIPSIPKI
jgi:hypothetical protein